MHRNCVYTPDVQTSAQPPKIKSVLNQQSRDEHTTQVRT
jgi:hypothetical protein